MKMRSILGALVIASLSALPALAVDMTPEDIKKLVDDAVNKKMQEHERHAGLGAGGPEFGEPAGIGRGLVRGAARGAGALERRAVDGEEVEEAVPAGVHAGGDAGPRDRALRWVAGTERREAALLGERGEVRQPSFIHELFQELGVEAVNAEDDEFLLYGRERAAAGHAKQHRGKDCGED